MKFFIHDTGTSYIATLIMQDGKRKVGLPHRKTSMFSLANARLDLNNLKLMYGH